MNKPFVLIVRGLPGSGKTTMADALVNMAPDKVVRLEADDFFINDRGEYQYDPTLIGHAHNECRQRFLKAIDKRKNIIISNTSVKYWEWGEYKAIAEKNDYIVHVIVKENHHDGMTTHGVPIQTVMKMKNNFTVNLLGHKLTTAKNYR